MIVFSKSDMNSARNMAEMQYLMRLDQILRQGINIQLVQHTTFNVVTQENMDKIYSWCMQFVVPNNAMSLTVDNLM